MATDAYTFDATPEILEGLASGDLRFGNSRKLEGAVSQHVYNKDGELVGHVAWRRLTAEELEDATDEARAVKAEAGPGWRSAGRILLQVAAAAAPEIIKAVLEARTEASAKHATETVRQELEKGNLRLVVDNSRMPSPEQDAGSLANRLRSTGP